MCIEIDVLPKKWKCALDTSKINKVEKCGDLRAINILPALSEILVKVIKFQLTTYLEINSVISHTQSWFTQKYSTTLALVNITDNILTASDLAKGNLLTIYVHSPFSQAISHYHYHLYADNTQPYTLMSPESNAVMSAVSGT